MGRRKKEKKPLSSVKAVFIVFFLPLVLLWMIIKAIVRAIIRHRRRKLGIFGSGGDTYVAKDSIMSETEKEYYYIIKEILEDKFILQPQVNLASVIYKAKNAKYRTELFRNIDFGVFNESYEPLLLIEINDRSHEQKQRIERDEKVRWICNEAGIPLVEFWTKDGVDKARIRKEILAYLQ